MPLIQAAWDHCPYLRSCIYNAMLNCIESNNITVASAALL